MPRLRTTLEASLEVPISSYPTTFRRLMSRLGLATLRGLAVLGRALGSIGRFLTPVARTVSRLLVRGLLLPLYKLVVMLQIRLGRLFVSARGFFFFLFTNRYVFHVVLVIISAATLASQLKVKNATAYEAGQGSLLYALVTNGKEDMVEEPVRPELIAKNTHYLGAGTIEAVPSIDYDYEDTEQLPDMTVPGSIAIIPGTGEEPGIPSETPTTPAAPRKKIETYAVRSGDTVTSIAHKFGVTVGTIISANDLSKNGALHIGDSLKIPAVTGVVHVVTRGDTIDRIARLYKADATVIRETNELTPKSTLTIGTELLIPGGIEPEIAIPVAVKTPSTPVATKPPKITINNKTVTLKPDVPIARIKNKAVDVYQEIVNDGSDTRAKPADVDATAPVSTKQLLWPTNHHIITQYYGWKHTGVDLDGDYTDPIYASADGVVTTVGWNNGGYGLQIIIDHPNGIRTRYAHSSKVFVTQGQQVKRGEVIAMIGTTGRSTGTHLHYEVYVNGVRKNPLTYTK